MTFAEFKTHSLEVVNPTREANGLAPLTDEQIAKAFQLNEDLRREEALAMDDPQPTTELP